MSVIPANRINFIVLFKGYSQLYASASKKVALETAPPLGVSLSDKKVFFITHHPDEDAIVFHSVPDEEVQTATIKQIKKKDSEDD